MASWMYRALAGLTNLTELDLSGNDIVDVSPLANLTQHRKWILLATK